MYFAYTPTSHGYTTFDNNTEFPINSRLTIKLHEVTNALYDLYMVRYYKKRDDRVQAWYHLLHASMELFDLGPNMDIIKDPDGKDVDFNSFVGILSETALAYRQDLSLNFPLSNEQVTELRLLSHPRVFQYYNAPILLPHLLSKTSACLRCLRGAVAE